MTLNAESFPDRQTKLLRELLAERDECRCGLSVGFRAVFLAMHAVHAIVATVYLRHKSHGECVVDQDRRIEHFGERCL